MNLQNEFLNLFELYGIRNAMYLRGDMRALFLHDSFRTFSKMIRKKEPDKKVLAQALASVFGRTASFADSFINLPLVEAICEKYPLGHCGYCQLERCECDPSQRNDLVLSAADSAQLNWSVSEWITHIHSMYGESNGRRGIEYMLLRLIEEIHEAEGAHLFDNAHDPKISVNEIRQNIAREFADVFAWIFAIAGYLSLDLETALRERYHRNCKYCRERPCQCGSRLIKSSKIHRNK